MADRKITAIAAPNAAGIPGMLDLVAPGGQLRMGTCPRYPLSREPGSPSGAILVVCALPFSVSPLFEVQQPTTTYLTCRLRVKREFILVLFSTARGLAGASAPTPRHRHPSPDAAKAASGRPTIAPVGLRGAGAVTKPRHFDGSSMQPPVPQEHPHAEGAEEQMKQKVTRHGRKFSFSRPISVRLI